MRHRSLHHRSTTTPWRFTDVSDRPLVPHIGRCHRDGGGVMTTAEANGIWLGVEHFGDAAAPLVLLAGVNDQALLV